MSRKLVSLLRRDPDALVFLLSCTLCVLFLLFVPGAPGGIATL